MLLSLLFLIILAILAYKSGKILLSGITFGVLKATATAFLYLAEAADRLPYDTIALLVGTQFGANSLLGIGIAYLVVKHSQNWKGSVAMTALAVLTFTTTLLEEYVLTV